MAALPYLGFCKRGSPMIYAFYAVAYVLVFWLCASIGSFLNVVAYRVPRGESFVRGRSHCPSCGTQILNRDLVPIFSYLYLNGKCRACGSSISQRYMMVEMSMGFVGLLTCFVHGFTLDALMTLLFAGNLLVIALIDQDTMTIPDSLVVVVAILAVPLCWIDGDVTLLSRVLGLFVISVPMLLLTLAVPGAFGGGDIKLIAACGLFLGLSSTIFAMFVAILLGGSFATYLLASGKSKKGAHMPFGPAICGGCYVAALWGSELVTWYLGKF